jgi:preprotein translocase subunit SecF
VAAIIANLHDVIGHPGFFAFQWEFRWPCRAAVLAVPGLLRQRVGGDLRIRENFQKLSQDEHCRDHRHAD